MGKIPDLDFDFWFKAFGARLVLAVIQEYNYVTDDSGAPIKDANGNKIPDGTFKVLYLDRHGNHNRVPIMLPNVGNSVFIGSLPEIGAVCLLGFRENSMPVILGFLPHSLDKLFSVRGEIPNMMPGEHVIQSSDTFLAQKDNSTPELGPTMITAPAFFSGARIKWDKYGRLIIQARGYDCIYGPLLSNEYTDKVAIVKDPVTGIEVFFRERFASGVIERRVDQVGNDYQFNGKDFIHVVDGKFQVRVSKGFRMVADGGLEIADGRGNHFYIDESGNLEVKTIRGNIKIKGNASVYIQAGGNAEMAISRASSEIVGDVKTQIIGNEKREVIGTDRYESVGRNKYVSILGNFLRTIIGNVLETVQGTKTEEVTGVYLLVAGGSMTISSPSILLGAGAIEPVVKGAPLLAKFNQLSADLQGLTGLPEPLLLLTDFSSIVKVAE